MKVTFLQDTQPIPQTGNEQYAAGTQADLRHGAWLVEMGYAREGWGKTPVVPSILSQSNEPQPRAITAEMITAPDYAGMKVAELRTLAKDAGINAKGKRKVELVAALEALE